MKSLIITIAGLSLPSIVHCVEFSESGIEREFAKVIATQRRVKMYDPKVAKYGAVVIESYVEQLVKKAAEISKKNRKETIDSACFTLAVDDDAEFGNFLEQEAGKSSVTRILANGSIKKAAPDPKKAGISTKSDMSTFMSVIWKIFQQGKRFMLPLIQPFVVFTSGDTKGFKLIKKTAVKATKSDLHQVYILKVLAKVNPEMAMTHDTLRLMGSWINCKSDKVILEACQSAEFDGKTMVTPKYVEEATKKVIPAKFAKTCVIAAKKSFIGAPAE